MATRTILELGPADHDRPLSLDEYLGARGREGYRYELIDGRVVVSPAPSFAHEYLVMWLVKVLERYAERHPEVINFVSARSRVFVPGRPGATTPEPDLVAFRDVPHDVPISAVSWDDLTPVLVAEFVSPDNPDKDLVRNVTLYELTPTVREYWIIDPRPHPDRPSLRVYRRRGARWQRPIDVAFGDTYTTRLLPGFALTVDPRAR
jgi:Uma2 family endonuclease